MIKIRMTFVDDENGLKELSKSLDNLKKNFDILSISKVYKGRGSSKYSNIYIDVNNKEEKE